MGRLHLSPDRLRAAVAALEDFWNVSTHESAQPKIQHMEFGPLASVAMACDPVITNRLVHDAQKLSRLDNGHALVLAKGQQIGISCHEIVCGASHRATKYVVIVRIPADSRRGRVRQQDGLGSQQVEECSPVGGGDGVLPGDLRTSQDLPHLVDLPRREKQDVGTASPCIDQLGLETLRAEKAVD